jgi:hypothetical protein
MCCICRDELLLIFFLSIHISVYMYGAMREGETGRANVMRNRERESDNLLVRERE